MENLKSIIIPAIASTVIKSINPEKERKKRQVTDTTKWTFQSEELKPEYQWSLIKQMNEKNVSQVKHCHFVSQQIRGKISSYRSQDIDKKILQQEKLIDEDFVIKLLFDSNNKCYYCKNAVNILYEYVREPKQWSLDRLDNSCGHNKDNVVIACLNCNLRRKTMYHERFVFTKQLNIVKSGVYTDEHLKRNTPP
jgi:hypothetical protein